MKPIIKWVGGKTQLLQYINENLPREYNRYLEPFMGGAAVLLNLNSETNLVNDLNSELINLYKVVRSYPKALIKKLKEHEKNHSDDYYYEIRRMDVNPGLENLNNIYRASRFIYLNKAGFNGMYRVNSDGYMNVPSGKRECVNLYNEESLFEISAFFKENVTFYNQDYYKFISDNVQAGDFIYLDPPYDPIDSTSSFTGYQKDGFSKEDQVTLRDLCIEIHNRGAYFLLSNSDTEFINHLYSEEVNNNFRLIRVPARRSINSNGNGRGPINEVLVKNY